MINYTINILNAQYIKILDFPKKENMILLEHTTMKTNATKIQKLLVNYYNRLFSESGLSKYENKAHNISLCGSFLEVWTYNDPQKKQRLKRANFCHDRLCPYCSYKLSREMFPRLKIASDLLKQDGYQLYFLTLTVDNVPGDNLMFQMDKLFADSRRFMRSQGWLDYYKSYELTYNAENDTYHPHLHYLVALKDFNFYPGFKADIAAKWHSFFSGAKAWSFLEVDFQRVVDDGSICELLKYVVKPGSLNNDTLDIIYNVSYGRRHAGDSGLFRTYMQKAKAILSLTQLSEDTYLKQYDYSVEKFFWNDRGQKYVPCN